MGETQREKLRTSIWWTRELHDGISDLIVKAAVKNAIDLFIEPTRKRKGTLSIDLLTE